MSREASFSPQEVVGVAAVAAASLGSIIVALGRSQAAAAKSHAPSLTHVSEAAKHQLEHGKQAARSAAEVVVEAYPGIREHANELISRVGETTRPQAARASELAASGAHGARSTGTMVLERLQEVVLPAAAEALGSLKEQSAQAGAKAGTQTTSVAASSVALADAAVSKSTSAARDAVATMFWTSAALSIVYFLLLNEERRERVRSTILGVYEQSRLLIQDFQGYEEEV